MVADKFTKLAQEFVPSVEGVIYTAPAGRNVIVRHAVIANPTVGSVFVTVFQDGEVILPESPIMDGGRTEFDGVITLRDGGEISAVSDVDGVLIFTLHGLETR